MSKDLKKKDFSKVKLKLMPGKATPAPPVGSVLGQRKVNIMNFCKEFNDKSKSMDPSMPVIVTVIIKADLSFEMVIKKPSISELIKKHSGMASGSKTPGKEIVGSITSKSISEIAEYKMSDMNANSIEAAISMVSGTAVSMGIKVSN